MLKTPVRLFLESLVRASPNPPLRDSVESFLTAEAQRHFKFPRFIVDTISERLSPWQRRDRRAHAGASEPSGMHHRQRRSEDQGAPRGESHSLSIFIHGS